MVTPKPSLPVPRRVFASPVPSFQKKAIQCTISERLYTILQTSPYLVEYIKEVEVYEGQRERQQNWAASDDTLPVLLRMLVNLEKIRLHPLNWEDFSELSTLEIEDGHFKGMGEFGSLLCHAKSLTHLSVTNISWGREEAGQVSEPPKKTHLVDLQL